MVTFQLERKLLKHGAWQVVAYIQCPDTIKDRRDVMGCITEPNARLKPATSDEPLLTYHWNGKFIAPGELV